MKTIYISAGHGAGDPGASAFNHTEADVAYKTARDVVKASQDLGFPVVLVPTFTLKNRIAWLNKHMVKGDVLMELHMNAAGLNHASGSEIYVEAGDDNSYKAAEKMAVVYASMMGFKNRGVKLDSTTRFKRLGILRDTPDGCEKMLVEMGFITTETDLDKVLTTSVDAIKQALYDVYGHTVTSYHKVSDWALEAVEAAKRHGITDFSNPQEIIGTKKLWYIMRDLGGITEDENKVKHVNLETFVTWLHRQHLLD